jgi:hypothetical protein
MGILAGELAANRPAGMLIIGAESRDVKDFGRLNKLKYSGIWSIFPCREVAW